MKTIRELDQKDEHGEKQESIRSKKMGELHSHYEQQCPVCKEWKARFNSTFDRCKECRGVS